MGEPGDGTAGRDVPPLPYRFLLDEDLSPRIAQVARGLGVDAVSVLEVNRLGLPDDEQLRWAAGERRVVVTRNRDDFIEWTTVFFQRGEPHAGVLVVPTLLSIQRPERVAHALRRWARNVQARFGERPLGAYFIEFLAE